MGVLLTGVPQTHNQPIHGGGFISKQHRLYLLLYSDSYSRRERKSFPPVAIMICAYGGGLFVLRSVSLLHDSCGMSSDLLVHLSNLVHALTFVSRCGDQPGDKLHLLICHKIFSSL
jgi:hypothetical protein